MDSATSALQQLNQRQPLAYKRLCADTKTLFRSPVFARWWSQMGILNAINELSFVPQAGATTIDPLLAALREGSKIPFHMASLMNDAGIHAEDVEHEASEVQDTYRPPHE